MTPQKALEVLIENSNISEEAKVKFLGAIESMSEEDVMALGKELAEQRKKEIAQAKNVVEKIDEFLEVEPPVAE